MASTYALNQSHLPDADKTYLQSDMVLLYDEWDTRLCMFTLGQAYTLLCFESDQMSSQDLLQHKLYWISDHAWKHQEANVRSPNAVIRDNCV